MGKGGKKKNWPRSWKQRAEVGETVTLKGRNIERELVVIAGLVQAKNPEELAETVDETIIAEAKKQPPS